MAKKTWKENRVDCTSHSGVDIKVTVCIDGHVELFDLAVGSLKTRRNAADAGEDWMVLCGRPKRKADKHMSHDE